MSFKAKNILYEFTRKPLQLATMPYHQLMEKRRLAQEIQARQRKMAEEANSEFLHFHEMLWSYWPDAVEHVRQHIRREENTNE